MPATTPVDVAILAYPEATAGVVYERGVHARNYSDLPLFDIVFGTFHNPRDFAMLNGFYDGASSRVAEMLAWRDVSRPAASRAVPRAVRGAGTTSPGRG